MIPLHSHGVSTSRTVRIFKICGKDAIAVVSEKPYRLTSDIRGIGFLAADTIAQKMGIALDSPLRARAGVSYMRAEASSEGHCGLPHQELVELAGKLLDIPAAVTEQANLEDTGEHLRSGRRQNGETTLVNSILTILRSESCNALLCAPIGAPPNGCPNRLGWRRRRSTGCWKSIR